MFGVCVRGLYTTSLYKVCNSVLLVCTGSLIFGPGLTSILFLNSCLFMTWSNARVLRREMVRVFRWEMRARRRIGREMRSWEGGEESGEKGFCL